MKESEERKWRRGGGGKRKENKIHRDEEVNEERGE